MSSRSILVTGGTGNTGGLVVQELLSQKESEQTDLKITVAYRNENKFNKLYGNKKDLINGIKLDLSNFDSYPQDLSDYDTIIFTHGSEQFITPIRFVRMLFHQFWPLHPYYIEYQSILTFVNAAKQTNPKAKFIVLSTMGTLNPFWLPTLILNGLICGAAKYKYFANQCVRQSGLDYVIFRPPGLVDPDGNSKGKNKKNADKKSSDEHTGMLNKENDKGNDRFDFKNRQLCMNQDWKPLKGIKFSEQDAGLMSRSKLAQVIAQCAIDPNVCDKSNLKKTTINIWQGYTKDLSKNNAQLFDWNQLHNDNSKDLIRFNNIQHDTPYWICMSTLVVLIAIILFVCLF